jgi:hypothetical protein
MILALCFALVQAVVPLLGAWRGDRLWMSLAQPAAWGQFAFLVFAFGCLTYAFMVDDFSVAYVANNSNSCFAVVLQIQRSVGRPRRFIAAVGTDPRWLDVRGVGVLAAVAASHARPRSGSNGHDQHRFSAVPDPHVQPVQTHLAADAQQWRRPQSLAARHRPDRSPADAVHGLRGLFGGVRLRHRGVDGRSS